MTLNGEMAFILRYCTDFCSFRGALYKIGWQSHDISIAISRKRYKITGKLVVITDRKSCMSFGLVPKSVTLNDLERRNGPYLRYFTEFGSFRGALR